MKRIGEYIKWYLYITTCILIVYTVIVLFIYHDKTIPADSLWQILVSGFLTTLATIIFTSKESATKSGAIIQTICHYISLCAVMILCGKWFGWLNLDPVSIFIMILAVAVVYLLVIASNCIIDYHQATAINHKLEEKYGKNIEKNNSAQ